MEPHICVVDSCVAYVYFVERNTAVIVVEFLLDPFHFTSFTAVSFSEFHLEHSTFSFDKVNTTELALIEFGENKRT